MVKIGLTITVDMELAQQLHKEAEDKKVKLSALVNKILGERYVK
jgi:hypothetical protein